MVKMQSDIVREQSAGSPSLAISGVNGKATAEPGRPVGSIFNAGLDLGLLALVLWLVYEIGTSLFFSPDAASSYSSVAVTVDDATTSVDFAMLADSRPFRSLEASELQSADLLPLTELNYSLLGVRFNSSGQSSILLQVPGQFQQSYVVGDDLAPGVRLSGIFLNYIRISRSGQLERLYLKGVDPNAEQAPVQPVNRRDKPAEKYRTDVNEQTIEDLVDRLNEAEIEDNRSSSFNE